MSAILNLLWKSCFSVKSFHRCLRLAHPTRNLVCRMATQAENSETLLPAKSDIYNGRSVDTNEITLPDAEFEKALKRCLDEWLHSNVRGVWFKVNLEHSSYIPVLVKHGFSFHHAKTSYAMMTRWLPANEPNLLPQYPHTHIGVAGMVINEKRQVLTIQEKYHKAPHLYWKLPGGYSNPGEDFSDTARREVFEETGIETEFLSVITLRHNHQHLFHCSDIYIVCHMRPITDVIQAGKDEIAQCQWMDIELYRNHPQVTVFNKYVMDAFLESEKLKCSIKPTPVLAFTKDTYHKVYNVKSTEEHEKKEV